MSVLEGINAWWYSQVRAAREAGSPRALDFVGSVVMMLPLLRAALAFGLVHVGSAAQPHKTYLWNVGGSTAITHDNGLPQAIALGEVVLLTAYYGKMPCLDCGTPKGNHGHQWCNGGIPQLANLTAQNTP